MPRRDGDLKGVNLKPGEARVVQETVLDDPRDPRTWSEEQRWDGMMPYQFEQTYRNAGVTKRNKMYTYIKRIGDQKKIRIIRMIEKEG